MVLVQLSDFSKSKLVAKPWLIDLRIELRMKISQFIFALFTQLVSRKNVYILYCLINKTNMNTALSQLSKRLQKFLGYK